MMGLATAVMMTAPAKAKKPLKALSKGQRAARVVMMAVAAASAVTVTMAAALPTMTAMRAIRCIVGLLETLMPTSMRPRLRNNVWHPAMAILVVRLLGAQIARLLAWGVHHGRGPVAMVR